MWVISRQAGQKIGDTLNIFYNNSFHINMC